jgi:hypothetical protein
MQFSYTHVSVLMSVSTLPQVQIEDFGITAKCGDDPLPTA